MSHQGPIHNLHNALVGKGKAATVRVTDSKSDFIDEGRFFGVGVVYRNIGSGLFADFLLRVPPNATTHGIINFTTTGTTIACAYGIPSISDTGTLIPVSNFNTTSPNVPQTQVFSFPTILSEGLMFTEVLIPGGSKGIGASTGELTKFILGPGDYIVRMENVTNNDVIMAFQFNFYEETIS